MTAVTFLDHLGRFLDEVLFPAMAAYVIFLVRRWLGLPGIHIPKPPPS